MFTHLLSVAAIRRDDVNKEVTFYVPATSGDQMLNRDITVVSDVSVTDCKKS